MARTRNNTKRTLFWIILIIIMISILEGGAMLIRRTLDLPSPELSEWVEDANLKANDDKSARIVPHPYLGYAIPATDIPPVVRAEKEPMITYGFHHGALVRAPQKDAIVVGSFGGSVAYHLARNEAAIEALEETLQTHPDYAGKRIIISGAAVQGFKQPHQLMSLSYLLSLGAHFDVILLLDGFNEVALAHKENINAGVSAHYPRQWAVRASFLNLDPRMRLIIADMLEIEERRKRLHDTYAMAPLRYSSTVRLLWNVLDGYAAWLEQRYERRMQVLENLAHKGFGSTGPLQIYAEKHDVYTELTRIWEDSARIMHMLSNAIGARFVHVLQPNQYVEGSKPLSKEEQTNTIYRPDHYYAKGVRAGYPMLKEAGTRLQADGIEFHDLTMLFKEHSKTLYIDSCCHVNEEGNILLGRGIGNAMLQYSE